MSVTFKEDLTNIQVKKIGNLENVITQLNWVLTATDSNGNTKTNNQRILLDEPDTKNFKEYLSLSKDEVRDWIRAFIPDEFVEARKKALETVLDTGEFSNPKLVKAPWDL